MSDSCPGSGRTAPPRSRPKRPDAEVNRARIVEIARASFTAAPDASLHSIAKAAGVGQGTLYRHFPSREALLLAVYRTELEALVAAAPGLLDEHEPLDALRLWLARLAAHGRSRCGASQAVEAATCPTPGSPVHPPVAAALDQLLTACKEARQLRPGADADEVLLLVSFLWKTTGGSEWQARTERLLGIVVDGLRTPEREDTHEPAGRYISPRVRSSVRYGLLQDADRASRPESGEGAECREARGRYSP
ncbi:TetR/AcrR family transcriptional regulator [Streptomyces atriruber]|uniref:TetR/AcrR family transcriptional regulator n=1 Tax=Streptomyces atriruber TaxID=545121 RepID=A0ABV3BKF8_9ACTN